MADIAVKLLHSASSPGGVARRWGRVLVLEPVEPLRQHLLDLVGDEGSLNARGVGTVAEAVKILRESEPALVLVGASLTGRDGPTTVRKLRAANANTRLLVFSNRHAPSHANRMLLAGANGYATLEDLDQLTDAIQDVLADALFISEHLTAGAGHGRSRDVHVPASELPKTSIEAVPTHLCLTAD